MRGRRKRGSGQIGGSLLSRMRRGFSTLLAGMTAVVVAGRIYHSRPVRDMRYVADSLGATLHSAVVLGEVRASDSRYADMHLAPEVLCLGNLIADSICRCGAADQHGSIGGRS